MKKFAILLIALIVSIQAYNQTVWTWTDSLDMSTLVGTDTVIQPRSVPTTVGSFPYVVQVDASGLNANDALFSFGGGAFSLLNGSQYKKYEPHVSSTLPFTLNLETMKDEINEGGNTVYTYTTSWVDDRYFYPVPAVQITKGSVSSGYVRWMFIFSRQ